MVSRHAADAGEGSRLVEEVVLQMVSRRAFLVPDPRQALRRREGPMPADASDPLDGPATGTEPR